MESTVKFPEVKKSVFVLDELDTLDALDELDLPAPPVEANAKAADWLNLIERMDDMETEASNKRIVAETSVAESVTRLSAVANELFVQNQMFAQSVLNIEQNGNGRGTRVWHKIWRFRRPCAKWALLNRIFCNVVKCIRWGKGITVDIKYATL
mmetsp:Transcript_6893/g.21705  ORF Transcript_6893/g.21705 Transcript_6893/m.21705 type:complete len:153 (-) Transcript_6893:477-935(-)